MMSSLSLACPKSFLRSPSLPRRRPPSCSVAVGSSSATLYDVLGVAADATGVEIKVAYRRLARSCHPDVVAAQGKGASAADEFMRVRAAYEILSDPEKRVDYDRRVKAVVFSALRTSWCSSQDRRPRTWETDQCW
nr:PREDICTED: chaperone protein dnaJ 11, chloroplastic-like [Musa acuminata subsp. malaccensis]